jgi:hypothetical protein
MNEDFAKQLQKRLDESLGYGMKNTPIQELSFPDAGMNPQPPIEQNPANDQTIVTQGETKQIDAPREDIAAQKQGGPLNAEVVSEISSLLISIGYILSKEGIVPDKFNTDAVLTVLNTHFKAVPPVTQEPPCENMDAITDISQTPQVNAEAPAMANISFQNPMVNAYMESRKLLESKNNK